MKKKIKIIDNVTGKTIEGSVIIRNKLHLEIQQKTKSQIFKPKKGRGSFKRNKKVDY